VKTIIKKIFSFIKEFIIVLIHAIKEKLRSVKNRRNLTSSINELKPPKYNNIICAGKEDFPTDPDDDYFSPSKWYEN
jgi:hypothetical protein